MTDQNKPLSFKERMALRQKEGNSAAPLVTPEEKKEVVQNEPAPSKPNGFGFRRTGETNGGLSQTVSNVAGNVAGDTSTGASTAPAPKRFGSFKPSVEEKKEGPVQAAIDTSPLPQVIQAYNVAGARQPTLGESISGIPPEKAVETIRQKIADMSVLEDGTEIRYEMEKLSEMLVANPAACLYLLDEDLGLAVRALRKMTNNRVAADMGRAKAPRAGSTKAAASRPMSAEEMAAAMNDL